MPINRSFGDLQTNVSDDVHPHLYQSPTPEPFQRPSFSTQSQAPKTKGREADECNPVAATLVAKPAFSGANDAPFAKDPPGSVSLDWAVLPILVCCVLAPWPCIFFLLFLSLAKAFSTNR